ncbi:MAG: leucine-rich repeat protein [Brotaphodocola sp.]
MDWKYTKTGQGVRIDKIEEPESVVVIPEELEGLPVTELGAYVMAHSSVEEIHFPAQLRKIGAYGFYGCEQLRRIYCYGRVLDLGAGLFADASNVEFLDITLFDKERSCFQELLSELRQTLRVRVHMPDGSEARLIFPEYYEESVENTPARILFIETHGCGHRYRYCFAKREFQFHGYDEVFQHVKVQESEALVTELAIGRLQYPMGLTERYREMYEAYVKEHWKMAGQLFLEADSLLASAVSNLEPGGISWLAETFLLERGQIAELAAAAQTIGDIEAVSWLMDFSHRKFGREEETSVSSRRRKRKFEL